MDAGIWILLAFLLFHAAVMAVWSKPQKFWVWVGKRFPME